MLATHPLRIVEGKINKVNKDIDQNLSCLGNYLFVWSRSWLVIGFILYQYLIQATTGASWAGVIGDILVHIFCLAVPLCCEDITKDKAMLVLYPLAFASLFGSFFYPLIHCNLTLNGWDRLIYLDIFLLELSLLGGITLYRCYKNRVLKKELKRLEEEEQECVIWINFLRNSLDKK